ncbi:hypothetical protein ACFL6M_00715 [Candidatus Eisenbacteria bacterium]|uniref:DUF4412 domain-containing protein n=1 Tax=Eiseniibacteriota bacterium TaxID=2212470 RepID=A0ABV6YID8_UNCEI
MRTAALIGVLVLAALGLPGSAHADLLVRQMLTSKTLVVTPGQSVPDRADTVEIWLGESSARVIREDAEYIFRFDEPNLYILDHDDQSYAVLFLPVDLPSYLSPGDPTSLRLSDMMKERRARAVVAKTEEQKRIGPWNAQLYRYHIVSSLITIRSETWTTRDVGTEVQGFFPRIQRALLSLNPGMRHAAVELTKVKGIPIHEIQTITTRGVVTAIERKTLEIRNADPPNGFYTPPSDYEEKPFDLAARVLRH